MWKITRNIKIQFTLKKFIIFILAFYLFYQPDLSFIFPILKNSVIISIIDIFLFFYYRKKIFFYLKEKNKIFLILLIMCVINAYTLIPTLLNHVSIINNLTSITFALSVFCLIGLFFLVDEEYITIEQKIDFLIRIGLIQSIICVLMLIFPFFKEIANILYTSNIANYETSPLFGITLYRIYGICGDYTFSTPIFLALLASMSLLFFFQYNHIKYLIYSLFLIFSSILNGRTGLLIFLLVSIIILFKFTSTRKFFKYLLIGFCGLGILLLILCFVIDTQWLEWIFRSFEEILLLFHSNKSSTFSKLIEFIFIPQGISLFFGYGSRVFGNYGLEIVNKMSDIGYINELWRGGLIYIIVFYTCLFILIKKTYIISKNYFNKKYSICITAILLFFLLISNYKGEALSGSSIFLAFVFIILTFLISGNKNEVEM